MKQLKLTFLHVDGGFSTLIWLFKIVENFSDAVELQTADPATINYKNHFTDDMTNAWTLTNNFSVR